MNDLIAVYGLNIYKFHIDIPENHTHRPVLREQSEKDKPWNDLFSEDLQIPANPNLSLTISFTRTDGQFGNALQTGQAKAEFAVQL